jgi:hypothetical protein
MPTISRKTINRWTPSTPVRADFGGWIAYLSIDAATVRAASGTRESVIDARAQLRAGVTIEHRDRSTYRLVSRSGE